MFLTEGFLVSAVGFASFTTMIPLFVATLTSSATLIGLVPAIHTVGWQLPQLFLAKRIAKMERVKPYVMFMTVQERLPILGLGIVGLLIPVIGVKTALVLTFFFLIWQGIGSGLTANAGRSWSARSSPAISSRHFLAHNRLLPTCWRAWVLPRWIIAGAGQTPYDFATCFFIATGLARFPVFLEPHQGGKGG